MGFLKNLFGKLRGNSTNDHVTQALPHLNEADVSTLSNNAKILKFTPLEVVIKQGKISDAFYILTKGLCEVVQESPMGEQRLGKLKPGDFFGEVGLRKGLPRTASVRALTQVEVLQIDPKTFMSVLEDETIDRRILDKKIGERVGEIYGAHVGRALPNLDETTREALLRRAKSENYTAGQIIIEQGTEGDDFFIIVHGKVEAYGEKDGKREFLSQLGSGQYFGEIALRMKTVRTATVRAVTDVEVLRLDKEGFKDLVERSDISREEMDSLVAQRIEMFFGIAARRK